MTTVLTEDQNAPQDSVQPTEAPAEVTADVQPTEAPAEKQEPVVDTSTFDSAFGKLLSSKATKPETLKGLIDNVTKAYSDLANRQSKAVARKRFTEELDKAIRVTGDIAKAQLIVQARDATLEPSASSRAPKGTPTEVAVARVAGIQLAYNLATAAADSAEKVNDSWRDKVDELVTAEAVERAQAYVKWLEGKQEGAEPEASEAEKVGARLSLGRGPGGQGRKPGQKAEKKGENTPAPNESIVAGMPKAEGE